MAQNLNAFANAYGDLAKINQYDASLTAGNALNRGDVAGAQSALYGAGDIAGGQQVQQYSDTQRVQHAQAAQRISQGIRAAVQAGHTPAEAFAMAVQLAPQMGVDAADVAKLKPAFDQDPVGTLNMVDQQAKKELQFFQTDGGILAGDKATGKVAMAYATPGKPIALDPDKNYIQADAPGQPNASAPMQTQAPAQRAAQPSYEDLRGAVRAQESSNRPGVVNQTTGAAGTMQVMPATGAAMARKLGITWRPDLMVGKTPEAAAYQDAIGNAYLQEAWDASNGDPQKTLAYYYGGPNLRQHGPKTAQYVTDVMGRLQPTQVAGNIGAPLQGGTGSDQITQDQAPPGYHFIQRAQPGNDRGGGKWEVYTDPKTNTQFRYNAATHEATTLDGQPYAPGALAKLSGGGTPRSAAALATQRYIQEHPDATAEDVSQFNASLNMQRTATAAFGSGKQGQTINSLNVSIDHLSTLQDLSTALGNGNIQAINSVRQKWNTQTGNPAPANFEAAKQIVADEIVKGIVGAGGGVADREKAQAAISSAASPQQLAGVIGTYKQLLAGQLNGLRLQYKNTTGRDDFESKLLPETRAQLEGVGPAAPQGNGRPGSTWSRLTPAQRQTAMQFRGSTAPVGEPANPYVPTSQAEFERLPVGKWFINPADGQKLRKTH